MITYTMLQGFLQGFKQLAFPDNCLLCRTFLNSGHQRQLCEGCWAQIEYTPPPFCHRCPRPVGAGRTLCASCVTKRFAFDQAWAACIYNESLQKLLHTFKYGDKASLHKTFVPFMMSFINRNNVPVRSFDLIIPVPLHPTRLRERGFNQSALLSRGLAAHYGLSHAQDILERSKWTSTQTALEAKQRWTNMDAAFKMKNSTSLTGKNILLVDDLFTTGATLDAAAKVLNDSGVAQVSILTLSVTI